MPCSDSSSSISFKIDNNENFISYEYAKITCGREIDGKTGLNEFYKGKDISDILQIDFIDLVNALKVKEEEAQFILYLEWDALRSAIAQYIGVVDESIDTQRCQITSIEEIDEGLEISQVILPPREMPKILPCSLGDTNTSN